MSDALIRTAFETRLAAWAAAQVPPIPITFENAMFSPPAGRYVECAMIPDETACEMLNGEHRRYMGLYQVKLYLLPGKGSGEATALAASLDAAFPMTAPIAQSGAKVFVLSPMSKRPAQPHPDRYVVPVSCTYRADIIV